MIWVVLCAAAAGLLVGALGLWGLIVVDRTEVEYAVDEAAG